MVAVPTLAGKCVLNTAVVQLASTPAHCTLQDFSPAIFFSIILGNIVQMLALRLTFSVLLKEKKLSPLKMQSII
jgi:hypothetical protein